MSEDDLDLVLRWSDAWNRIDLDSFFAMFDTDAEVITDPSFAETGTFRGPPAITNWFEGLKESWDGDQIVLTELFDSSGKVVARLDWMARGRASGMETRMKMTAVLTIKDGIFSVRDWRISRVEWFFDHDDALKAVGLAE